MGSNHTYRYLNVEVSDVEPADLGSTLEKSSWQAIAYHAAIGDLSDHFNIGDTKTIPITYTEENQMPNCTITMKLADFNHDNTTGTVDFIVSKYSTSISSLTVSIIPSTTVPYVYGHMESMLRGILNLRIFQALGSLCNKYIIERKTFVSGWTQSNTNRYACYDKIWIPSEKEVWGQNSYGYWYIGDSESQYPIYGRPAYDNSTRIIRMGNYGIDWFTRTCSTVNGGRWVIVDSSGQLNEKSTTNGVIGGSIVFGFRMGKKS